MGDFEVKLIASLVRNMVDAETEEDVDMIYERILTQLDLCYKSVIERLNK